VKDYSKLLDLAKNGIITTKDIVTANVSKDYLKYAIQDNVIEKVAHGVYIPKHEYGDTLFIFQLRNSKLIFSCYTSAYLLGMTTRDTDVIYASAPLNYNTSKLQNGNVILREKELLHSLGQIEVSTMFGNRIKVHDAERTVCDFFNPKYIGDKFVKIEVLKNYLQSKEKNLTKLFDYAKTLGVLEELRKRVEVLL